MRLEIDKGSDASRNGIWWEVIDIRLVDDYEGEHFIQLYPEQFEKFVEGLNDYLKELLKEARNEGEV